MLFHVTGSEVVRFKAGGNVGIGTNNPDHTLHVVGNLRVHSSGVEGIRMAEKEIKLLNANFHQYFHDLSSSGIFPCL